MDAAIDVYKDPRCQVLCGAISGAGCANAPTLESCVESCTLGVTTMNCTAEWNALLTCFENDMSVACMNDEAVPTACTSEGQALGMCMQ